MKKKKYPKAIYPPSEPWKPRKPERRQFAGYGAIKGKDIYHDVGVNGDADVNLEEIFEDMDEELPNPAIRYWQKLSLQDIVDLAPPGTKLSDIIFGLSFPRDYSYTEVFFSLMERNIEREEVAYKQAMEKYEKDMEAYNERLIKYKADMKRYEYLKKQEEIKELEQQLKDLKQT